MRKLLAVALLVALPATAAGQVRTVEFASGFTLPLGFIQDPSNPAVQYVLEQGGRIRVIVGGSVRSQDFLNLTTQISSGGERGLLGLAFPPDYGTSGRFYVNFTNPQGHTVVARFKRSTSDPLVADASSRFDLRWGGAGGQRFISQPASNHNGGCMHFGPDGFLYIAMGDGGGSGDPSNNAQDPGRFLGKMLRIDVNVADGHTEGYVVPNDNPFVDNDPIPALHEIWAFGLRNPWRFSFDRVTGAMLIGDVGQGAREEVDFQPPGLGGINWGWRVREGTLPFDSTFPVAYLPLRDPIHDYGRTLGRSITGGYVYRGSQLATMAGRYFYADFSSARVWSFALSQSGAGAASDVREHTAELGGTSFIGNISSFGEDANGEIYLVSYSTGRILKILPGCGYQLSPPSRIFTSAGGELQVTLATADGCAWSVTGTPEWITVSPTSGAGPATLTVNVAALAGNASRTGGFSVQGASFTATQAPAARPGGDFDGDGRMDLLLRHAVDGFVGVWLMNGTTLRDGRLFSPGRVADTQWTIVGSADMNGDAQPDLVWQHDDGALAVWFMNGTTQLNVVFLTPSAVPHRDWRVVSVADFNDDDHPDLLLQHRTERNLAVWLMNGTTLVDGRLVSPPRTMDPLWDAVGGGDFNRDGHTDIVLQHADGTLAVWLMNQTDLIDGRLLSHALPDARWRVLGVGDLDGDGHTDLVLQHGETRQLGAWLLRDLTLSDGRLLSPSSLADPAWRVVGPK